jgi:hypothetical protein
MKRAILTAALMISAVSSLAITKRSFCYQAKKQAAHSEQALGQDGKYLDTKTGSMEYFRGCRFDIPWMQEMRLSLCENNSGIQDIQIPEYIFFVFDGAADFDAQRATSILDIANLDGSEGRDMGRGNMNGGSFFLNKLKDQELIKKEKLQVHYHASSGFHERENFRSAIGCAKEMDRYFDMAKSLNPNLSEPKLITFGYSNGGVNAIKFQKDITKRAVKRPADLVITIDPIPKAAAFLFKQGSEFEGKRDRQTKRFINLYQDVDYGSFHNLKLRGRKVKNADKNIHVTHENSPYSIYRDGAIAHLTIIDSLIVENTFNCELAKLVDDQAAIEKDCFNNPFQTRYHQDNFNLAEGLDQLEDHWIE